MSHEIQHKGYVGSAEFSDEDEVFHGKLLGIRDLVTYEAKDVVGLKQSFRDAVEDYLRTCADNGRSPDQPFRGSFNVRVGRQLHRKAAVFAHEHNKRLNTIVTEALEKYLETGISDD